MKVHVKGYTRHPTQKAVKVKGYTKTVRGSRK